jgi:two-component system, CitB family, sensor kinase
VSGATRAAVSGATRAAVSGVRLWRVSQPLIPSVKRTWGIQQRFFLLQAGLFAVLTIILAGVQISSLRTALERDYGTRALNVSRSVALMPSVIEAMDDTRPQDTINPLVNQIRQKVEADFIVVGNLQEVRYSHPLPERIGQKMVGGDNAEPLAGREIVSTATGSLGRSIRGKVPIFKNGVVIGIVSTGFLLPTVQSTFLTVLQSILPWYGVALLVALVSSSLIARRLKREMLDLEPEQIAALVRQHQATLSAMQEGVLVLDPDSRIQVQNARAAQMLGTKLGDKALEVWRELLPLEVGQNQPRRFGQQHLMLSMLEMGEGWRVLTFRDRAEVLEIAEQLTQTKEYAALLRAQTHEFQNRLHTISGLIQLGDLDAALLVIRQSSERRHALHEVLAHLEIPQVAALLIGKFERASELGVELVLDDGSSLPKHWATLGADRLCLIVGNLLENAFEAALSASQKRVELMLGADPEGLQIEVRDAGAGVPLELEGRVFERSVSSKGEGRGYGLYLLRQQVLALGGTVRHFRFAEQTVFQVSFGVDSLEGRVV